MRQLKLHQDEFDQLCSESGVFFSTDPSTISSAYVRVSSCGMVIYQAIIKEDTKQSESIDVPAWRPWLKYLLNIYKCLETDSTLDFTHFYYLSN